jgi:hypothetical protein
MQRVVADNNEVARSLQAYFKTLLERHIHRHYYERRTVDP